MTKKLLLIDIDGLRPDVFTSVVQSGNAPALAEILGGFNMQRSVQIPALSTAPSITFCAQASLFTGKHPKNHSIPGNQFFDRFGLFNNGVPIHYAFDLGDTLEVNDAVGVYTNGLASNRVLSKTIYERAAEKGLKSVVVGHMYATGADTWIKPSLTKVARFLKGENLLGLSSAEFDRHIAEKAIDHIGSHGMPDILTVYFLGLDHESHMHGPSVQVSYLSDVIDPLIGQLLNAIKSVDNSPSIQDNLIAAIFSDHGHIQVIKDNQHSLRIGFPFDQELSHLFKSLNLDLHDFPGEDPNCDAVMTLNGGLASVYLQNQKGRWADLPDFSRDVLPVAKAFWEAHTHGTHAPELHNSLAGVLLRDVQNDGWEAPFKALAPDGDIQTLETWFSNQPASAYADPVNRLNNAAGLYAGDLLLISNYAAGYYFGSEMKGVHGGLHPNDSLSTLIYSWPGASEADWEQAKSAIETAISQRCANENNREPCITDLITGLSAIDLPLSYLS